MTVASGASAGADVPAVNFCFHNLTADTGAPVIVSIIFYSVEYVDMLVSRAQLEITLSAQLCFPIQCLFVRGVGGDFRGLIACGTYSPVTGFVCVIDILVRNLDLTLITATITEFVALGAVVVQLYVGPLVTAGTCVPVLDIVGNVLADGIVAVREGVVTRIAGVQATIREGMLLMLDAAAAIGAAGPVIQGILFPCLANSMGRNGLVTASGANFLVFGFVKEGEIAIFMFAGRINLLGRFCVTNGTNKLAATEIYAGRFLDDITGFPVMRFGYLLFTLGADLAVLIIISACPGAVIMVTVFLNTGLAAVESLFATGVRLVVALGADLVLLVRMIVFYLSSVVVAAAGIAGAAGTGVVGGAEVKIADLSLADHNTGAIIAGGTGVAFQSVEVCTVSIVNKTYMGETLLKEQVTLLGGVVSAILIGQTEVVGICQCGSLQYTSGNTSFLSAPADEHCTPGRIGHTVPYAVLGVVVRTFGITNLSQCNTDDVVSHVAGIFICILVSCLCFHGNERQHKGNNQDEGQYRPNLLFNHFISSINGYKLLLLIIIHH